MSLDTLTNFGFTTLSSALSSVATSASVADETLLAGSPNYAIIWDIASYPLGPPLGDPDALGTEIVRYTATSSGQLTGLSRGQDGTSAKSHASGAGVITGLVAAHLEQIRDGMWSRNGDSWGIDPATGGNVGIGTTSPGATLDVRDNGAASTKIRVQDAYNSNPNIDFFNAGGTRLGIIDVVGGSSSMQIMAGAGCELALGAGNTYGVVRLVSGAASGSLVVTSSSKVTTSGDVGVGEASPDERLHVTKTGDNVCVVKVEAGRATASVDAAALRLSATSSPAATDAKVFEICNVNGASSGENTLRFRALNDDETLKHNILILTQDTANIGFLGVPSAGGGEGIIFIGNRIAAPGSNPSGGGILYVESGALKYRGSSGTVTTIANA